MRQQGATVDIFSAVLLDDLDTIRSLLGQNPTLATTPGLNDAPPLHVATTPEAARILIDAGAPLDSIDNNGNSPLGAVVTKRRYDVAGILIEAGAVMDACMMAAMGRLDLLASAIDADTNVVHATAKIGQMAVVGTPLHAASQHDRVEVVRLLLSRGADPNVRADMGQTPLHLCVSMEVASSLIEAGADASAVDDEHGTTPLTWAEVGVDIHGPSEEREALVEYLKGLGSK